MYAQTLDALVSAATPGAVVMQADMPIAPMQARKETRKRTTEASASARPHEFFCRFGCGTVALDWPALDDTKIQLQCQHYLVCINCHDDREEYPQLDPNTGQRYTLPGCVIEMPRELLPCEPSRICRHFDVCFHCQPFKRIPSKNRSHHFHCKFCKRPTKNKQKVCKRCGETGEAAAPLAAHPAVDMAVDPSYQARMGASALQLGHPHDPSGVPATSAVLQNGANGLDSILMATQSMPNSGTAQHGAGGGSLLPPPPPLQQWNPAVQLQQGQAPGVPHGMVLLQAQQPLTSELAASGCAVDTTALNTTNLYLQQFAILRQQLAEQQAYTQQVMQENASLKAQATAQQVKHSAELIAQRAADAAQHHHQQQQQQQQQQQPAAPATDAAPAPSTASMLLMAVATESVAAAPSAIDGPPVGAPLSREAAGLPTLSLGGMLHAQQHAQQQQPATQLGVLARDMIQGDSITAIIQSACTSRSEEKALADQWRMNTVAHRSKRQRKRAQVDAIGDGVEEVHQHTPLERVSEERRLENASWRLWFKKRIEKARAGLDLNAAADRLAASRLLLSPPLRSAAFPNLNSQSMDSISDAKMELGPAVQLGDSQSAMAVVKN